MKKIFVYVLIVLVVGLTSCNNWGPRVEGVGASMEETRDADGFYSVSNTTSFEVYVTQADTFSLRVIAQENILPLVETTVSGSTLLVKTKEFTWVRTSDPVEVHVTMPEIESLNLSGSGLLDCGKIEGDLVELTITSSGRLRVDSVIASDIYIKHTASGDFDSELLDAGVGEIKLSGSGNLEFGDFYVDDISFKNSASGNIRGFIFGVHSSDIALSGSGRITLEGDTENLKTSDSASGRIDALDLYAVDVRTTSSGSGNTYVNVSGELDVTILGSGDVIYKGSPTDTQYKITGSGDLKEY